MKVDHIKVLLKDSEKDDSVAVGLERLKDKALITISEDNVISMHDIIQEKASEIVRLESIVDPGNRSQLMHPDDTYEVLKYNKGTEAIRSIRADLSVIRKLQSKNQKRFKIKVEAMAAAVACQRDVGLKGLGVSLINTSAYHSFRKHINTTKHRNFVQEMSTSADHSFIQRIKTSADHQLHSANKILSRSQLHSTNGSI
ncbi:Putative disease resistance protein [Glycine soja]|uniref:Putative disease resistance protein n=1 Tax=Glycine soja TaxID=3848 RepID=A0A0B2SXL2_GLYSO|nr:Putative disease resistance protein [Glycine soja]